MHVSLKFLKTQIFQNFNIPKKPTLATHQQYMVSVHFLPQAVSWGDPVQKLLVPLAKYKKFWIVWNPLASNNFKQSNLPLATNYL